MDHERVLAALDKEIDAARRTLEQLTTARQQYAAAHGVTGRRTASAPVADGDGAANGSLATLVLRVMADGAWRHVDDVLALVEKEGRSTTRASINATLCRGASETGPFERGRRGMYRVRQEIVAGWAERADASTSRATASS